MRNLINTPEIKSVNGRVLLLYNFENQQDVIEYQLEMLANNNIPQILKSDVIRINGQIRLSFDITSLIPLKKLFERREIGREDFIGIIKQLSSLLAGLEEYLLDYWRVIYNNEYIYINPQTLELGFVYLPALNIEDNGLESLREFLLNNIIHNIRFKNEQSDNYVQRFLELLKTQELSFSMLNSYANDMEEQQVFKNRPVMNFDSFYNNASLHRNIERNTQRNIEKKPLPEPAIQVSENNVIQKVIKKNEKLNYPIKSYIIMFSVIIALLILGAVLANTGILSFNNPDFFLSLFGYLLVCGALGYLLYSKLFTPDKMIKNTSQSIIKEDIDKKAVYVNHSQIRNSDPGINMNTTANQFVNKNIKLPQLNRQNKRPVQRPVHGPMNFIKNNELENDHTVFLDPGKINHPYLRRKNSSETIILSHFPFMFGRLEEQADYCIKNPAVGKLHAEITKEGSDYFLTDMNSRNGTIVNGEYLVPGQSAYLNNGDIICFANEEFTFFC